MLKLALGVIVLIAAGAWFVAVASVIAVLRLTPKGSRLAAMAEIHRMNFTRIEARSGRAALVFTNRYAIAFAVFFGCLIAAIALGAIVNVRSATPA